MRNWVSYKAGTFCSLLLWPRIYLLKALLPALLQDHRESLGRTQLRVAGSEKFRSLNALLKIALRNHSTCLVTIQGSLSLVHRRELETQEEVHDRPWSHNLINGNIRTQTWVFCFPVQCLRKCSLPILSAHQPVSSILGAWHYFPLYLSQAQMYPSRQVCKPLTRSLQCTPPPPCPIHPSSPVS